MTRPQIIAFAALCLCTSSTWIAAQALPFQLPALQAQGFHFFLLAIATTIFCLTQKQPRPNARTIIPGLALFAAPLILLEAAQDMVSSSFSVLVFALIPIAIAVVRGQIRWLIPALAGVAGILVLLPLSLPATPSAYIGLVLVLAAMGLTTAATLILHRHPPNAWSTVVIFVAAGLVLTLSSRDHAAWTTNIAATEALRCLVIDAPEVFLILWLIPRLDPRRLAARWLLAPALTIVEGFVLMHPTLDARLVIGLMLLAAGGVIVFAARDEEPESLRIN